MTAKEEQENQRKERHRLPAYISGVLGAGMVITSLLAATYYAGGTRQLYLKCQLFFQQVPSLSVIYHVDGLDASSHFVSLRNGEARWYAIEEIRFVLGDKKWMPSKGHIVQFEQDPNHDGFLMASEGEWNPHGH